MRDEYKYSFFSFLAFGFLMGAIFTFTTGNLKMGAMLGLVAGAFFGLSILLVYFLLQKSRLFGLKDIKGWADDEVIIRSGFANMMRHGLGEGGKLFLTNKRLRFCGHRAAAEIGDHSYAVAAIASATPCLTLGLVPNGLHVQLSDGRSVHFVVSGRREWVGAIRQELSSEDRAM